MLIPSPSKSLLLLPESHRKKREANKLSLLLLPENHSKEREANKLTALFCCFLVDREFLDDFMELLRRKCGTKRVHANVVYQEYIADRNHTHMNATQWETLTDFVKWLGREGTVNRKVNVCVNKMSVHPFPFCAVADL